MKVDWNWVGKLGEKSFWWAIIMWLGTIAAAAIPHFDTVELLLFLQKALWGVAMMNAAGFVLVGSLIYHHEGSHMMTRRDAIEWAIALVIFVVTLYLYVRS